MAGRASRNESRSGPWVSSHGVLSPPQSIPNALREAGEHDMADNLIDAGRVGFQRVADIFRNW